MNCEQCLSTSRRTRLNMIHSEVYITSSFSHSHTVLSLCARGRDRFDQTGSRWFEIGLKPRVPSSLVWSKSLTFSPFPWPFYTQFGSQIWLWSLCMIWIIYSYTIITQTDEVPKADFIDLLGIKWQTLVKIYHNWSKTYMLPFCWCTCCCMVFSISFSVLLMSLSACCW